MAIPTLSLCDTGPDSMATLNDLIAEHNILADNENYFYYKADINTATGTITIPTGATIVLDQFQGGADAFCSTIVNGKPTLVFPVDSSGIAVDVATFDALGNFTLTGTPSAYPVALIYILKIKAIDQGNLVEADIVEEYPIEELHDSVKIIARDTVDTAPVTGTTSETKMGTTAALIEGGAIKVGDVVRFLPRHKITGASGSSTIRMYINTSNSLSGAQMIGLWTAGSAWFQPDRICVVKSATVSEFVFTATVGSDTGLTSGNANAVTNLNIDWTVDQYFFTTHQPNIVGLSVIRSLLLVEKL